MFGLFGRKKKKEEAMYGPMDDYLIGKFYEHHEMTPPELPEDGDRQTRNCTLITTRIVGEAIQRHLDDYDFITPSEWVVLAFTACAVAPGVSRVTKGNLEKASTVSCAAVLAGREINSDAASEVMTVALKEYNSWHLEQDKLEDIKTVAAAAQYYLLTLEDQYLEIVARFVEAFLVPENDQIGP